MNETIKINDLSFYNDRGILTLSAKQYDTGRKFIFHVIDNGAPFDLSGCSVYLRMQKADNTQFQGEDCCLIEGNTVTVDTALGNGTQILSCAGTNNCELHFVNEQGKSLTTWNFILEVQKRVHNGEHMDSIDSWDAWDKMRDTVNSLELNLTRHLNNKENPHAVTKEQVGLGNVENKSSAAIRDELTKTNVTSALGYIPYTPAEIDNKFSMLESSIDWKESVNTFADISAAYPSPENGWTVNVKDTNYTYRYNGTDWIAISANSIPLATGQVDGLLSKESYVKYEDADSKKHIHDNKAVIDTITQASVNAWNTIESKADKADIADTYATKTALQELADVVGAANSLLETI